MQGRVQGVGFRWWTTRQAKALGLSGKDAARDAYRRALKQMGSLVGRGGAPPEGRDA